MNDASAAKTADKLLKLVEKRFRKESTHILTENDKDGIWFEMFGRLSRGESEGDVYTYCKTAKLKQP